MNEPILSAQEYSDIPSLTNADGILPEEATKLPSSVKSRRREIAEFLRKSLAPKRAVRPESASSDLLYAAGQVPALNPMAAAAQLAIPNLAPVFDPLKSAVLGGMAYPLAGWGALGAGAANALGANIDTDVGKMIRAMQPAPTTPEGAAATEAMGKLMQDLKIPDFAPTGRLSPRPLLTPQDVHVLGARGINLAREIGDIPRDYAAAQTGQTRVGPLGEPTLGAKLGALTNVDGTSFTPFRPAFVDAGDIVDMGGMTQANVPTPINLGQNTFAVRAKGQPLISPNLPPGVDSDIVGTGQYVNQPEDFIRQELSYPTIENSNRASNVTVNTALHEVVLKPNVPETPGAMQYVPSPFTAEQSSEINRAFNKWRKQQIESAYPDAPDFSEATDAYRIMRAQGDNNTMTLQLYDEFIASPQGKKVASDLGITLPSTAELRERIVAVNNWVNSQLTNYVRRQVGTEGEPLVDVARQGATILPRDRLAAMAEDYVGIQSSVYPGAAVRLARKESGFPIEGKYAAERTTKLQELNDVNTKIQNIESQRNVYRDQALQLGLPDPANLPEYAALTNPLNAELRKRNKLEDDIRNIEDALRVEILHDVAIKRSSAGNLLNRMEYSIQQLFPSLQKTPREQTVYYLYGRRLEHAGFADLARLFEAAVLSGKIPVDQVPKISVEKFVRDNAAARRKLEEIENAKSKSFIEDAQIKLRERLNLPDNLKFGNATVVEILPTMDKDLITQLVSEDTAVLDHCVGQGGSGTGKNPFTNDTRKYEPLRNILTGEPNPKSQHSTTSYIKSVIDDEGYLASLRDNSTGYPVGTIQLMRKDANKYDIGYVSGKHNGAIQEQYKNALRDYLNALQFTIRRSGDSLQKNGVYDLDSLSGSHDVLQKAANDANLMPASELKALTNKRFVTVEDVRNAVESVTLPREQLTYTPVADETPLGPEAQYRAFYDLMGEQGFDDRNSIPVYETIVNGAWQEGRTPLENATNIGAALAHIHHEMRDDGPLGPSMIGLQRLSVSPREHRQLRHDIDMMMARLSGQFPNMEVNQQTVTLTQPEMQRILTALTNNEPIPGPYFENNLGDFEPDPQHPANQPRQIPNFIAEDMARNLIEDSRIDNQSFDMNILRRWYAALETHPNFFLRIANLDFADQREAGQQVREHLIRLMPSILDDRDNDIPFAKGGLVSTTDSIALQLQKNGMQKDKALQYALRMANALHEARA
jgi:hypothetical protein